MAKLRMLVKLGFHGKSHKAKEAQDARRLQEILATMGE